MSDSMDISETPLEALVADLVLLEKVGISAVVAEQVPGLARLAPVRDFVANHPDRFRAALRAMLATAVVRLPSETAAPAAVLLGVREGTERWASNRRRTAAAAETAYIRATFLRRHLKELLDDVATVLYGDMVRDLEAGAEVADESASDKGRDGDPLASTGPVLITGMSGTGIGASLKRFEDLTPGYTILDIDAFLPAVARDICAALGIWVPTTLMNCFRLPEQILRQLWPAALERAAETFEGDPGKLILRTRACWYNLASTGLIPGASGESLRTSLLRPRLVVTLIDDIYDTLVRLRRPGELWSPKRNEDEAPPTRKLLKITAWREAEIHYSQEIARSLGVPFVLFALKQPAMTLARLLESPETKWIYLSHAIVTPQSTSAGDPEDFAGALERLSDRMQARGQYVVFEPTSIDEARFRRDADNNVLSPELRNRWNRAVTRPPDSLLWVDDFTAEEQSFMLQPFAAFPLEPARALRLLASELDEQIRWRDRQLVAQSRGLVAYRPFASEKGEVAGGVAHEVLLHETLRKAFSLPAEPPYVGRRSAALVYHPESDEHRRRVAAAMAGLDDFTGKQRRGLLAGKLVWRESHRS